MSDGLTDGYRAARAYEERRKRIDAFFGLVLAFTQGKNPGEELRAAFEDFDAIRYEQSIIRHRIAKERGRRWERFLGTLRQTVGRSQTLQDAHVQDAWGEILAAAIMFASPDVAARLQEASPFKSYRLGLFVPNGTDYHGARREPTILGDFAGALDALVTASYVKDVRVVAVADPDRAVVGFRGDEEMREPERGELRLIAALDRKAAR